jgi:SPP1 family predicted phage head-tail adaptor
MIRSAGELRERITLLAPPGGYADVYGERTGVPPANTEVWGKVESLGGSESARADRQESDHDYRITLRFLPILDARWSVAWRGRKLAITAVRDPDGRREWTEIACVEASDGV